MFYIFYFLNTLGSLPLILYIPIPLNLKPKKQFFTKFRGEIGKLLLSIFDNMPTYSKSWNYSKRFKKNFISSKLLDSFGPF